MNDSNDNTPRFLSDNYIYYLFSDTPRYAIFGQVFAVDADKTDQLAYSLTANPYVTINKHSGHLRLKHQLHRLADQILNVTAHVTDGLHKNRTSIHIYVRAVPDAQEPVLLAEPGYGLTINESVARGAAISNVYRRLQLSASTIDRIEILHDRMNSPFAVDEQGKATYSFCFRLDSQSKED